MPIHQGLTVCNQITYTHTYTCTSSWQQHTLMAFSSPAKQSAQPHFKKRSGTGLQLTINFIIDQSANNFLTVQSIHGLKIVENVHHNFPACLQIAFNNKKQYKASILFIYHLK